MHSDILRWSSPILAAVVAVLTLLENPSAETAVRQAVPASQPTFRSRTTVVEVDVTVQDRERHFVEDLRPDEFEVLEDGVPQRITAVYRVSPGASMTADPSAASLLQPPPPEQTQRVIIFCFDKGHILHLAGLNRARQAAIDFIRTGFRPGDVGGVIDGAVFVNRRLTSSPDELASAVASVQLRENGGDVLGALTGLAREFARRPGRKTVILLTEGWATTRDSLADVRGLADLAARANMRIYALDVRGLDRGFTSSTILTQENPTPPGTLITLGDTYEDGANGLAEGTGAYLIRNENDFGKAFAEIDRDTSSYYVVGFRSAAPTDGRFHAVRVRVTRKGVTVRARKGFVAAPAVAWSDADGPATQGVAAVTRSDTSLPGQSLHAGNSGSRRGVSQATPSFRSATTTVEVDVVVRDDRRRFVGDLQLGDFTVYEDGTAQSIATIYRVLATEDERAGLSPARASISASPRLPPPPGQVQRVFVLFFDQAHIRLGGFERARNAARDFCEHNLRPGDLAGIVDGRTMVNNRLTDSKEELLSALRTLTPSADAEQVNREMQDHPQLVDLVQAWRVTRNERSYAPGPTVADDVAATACQARPDDCATPAAVEWLKAQIKTKAEQLVQRGRVTARETLDTIAAVSNGLAPLPGRKTIVLLTDGFFAEDAWADLRTVVGRAAHASVSVYAIDPRGLNRGAATASLFTASAPLPSGSVAAPDAITDGPNSLAVDTGGYAIRNENDLGKALAEVERDTSSYYVLGFRTATPADGRFHTLRVTVKRPGVTVRARKGYLAVPPPLVIDAGGAGSSAALTVEPNEIGIQALSVKARGVEEIESIAGDVLQLGSIGALGTAAAKAAAEGWDAFRRGDAVAAQLALSEVAVDPATPTWVPYIVGWMKLASGDGQAAAESWERVRSVVPDFEPVYFDLAGAYWRIGDYAHSVARLRDAEARWPSDAEVRRALGVMLLALGAVDGAIDAFEQAVAADARDEEACYDLARTLELRFTWAARLDRSRVVPTAVARHDADRLEAITWYRRVLDLGGTLTSQARAGLRRLGETVP
jgi:VWFA-related protein